MVGLSFIEATAAEATYAESQVKAEAGYAKDLGVTRTSLRRSVPI